MSEKTKAFCDCEHKIILHVGLGCSVQGCKCKASCKALANMAEAEVAQLRELLQETEEAASVSHIAYVNVLGDANLLRAQLAEAQAEKVRAERKADVSIETQVNVISAELHPYDGLKAVEWSHLAAQAVVDNLLGRNTIKWAFEKIDMETRREITKTLATVIRAARREMSEAQPQRPPVTREQVREIIMRDVFVSFEEVYPDKAADAIMALIEGAGGEQ